MRRTGGDDDTVVALGVQELAERMADGAAAGDTAVDGMPAACCSIASCSSNALSQARGIGASSDIAMGTGTR